MCLGAGGGRGGVNVSSWVEALCVFVCWGGGGASQLLAPTMSVQYLEFTITYLLFTAS